MKPLLLSLVLGWTLAAHGAPSAPLQKQIDEYLQAYVAQDAFSGVVLVAKGDDVVFEKAYGMANYEFSVPNRPDTRFAIASITKRFTWLILERLQAEKKLAFSDPIAKWIPEFPQSDRITVDHLMRHTSGVRDPDSLRRTIRASRTPRSVVDFLKTQPIASTPGETYSYTTANYAILAHIIEQITGRSFASVVRSFIYEPAGMKDSGELDVATVIPRLANGYMPNPFGRGVAVCGMEDPSWKTGGGSSYSTARDLHRFARALYAGKLLPGRDPLMVFRHSEALGKKALSSNGSFPGAGANLLIFPDEAVTVVVLTNNYATIAGNATQDIAAMYFGSKVASPAVKTASNSIPFDKRFEGSYAVEGRPWTFTIAMRDGRPVVVYNEVRISALHAIDANTWFAPLDWVTMRLNVDEQGVFTGSFQLPDGTTMKLARP
jgi:CubicO group peptidase (beta-lactamase class C family)